MIIYNIKERIVPMNFLTKKTDSTFLLHIYVKPNSRVQKIVDEDTRLTVYLKSKPVQNKANKELITLFKKKLNLNTDQIQIISGLKTPNKTIQLKFNDIKNEAEIYNAILL